MTRAESDPVPGTQLPLLVLCLGIFVPFFWLPQTSSSLCLLALPYFTLQGVCKAAAAGNEVLGLG